MLLFCLSPEPKTCKTVCKVGSIFYIIISKFRKAIEESLDMAAPTVGEIIEFQGATYAPGELFVPDSTTVLALAGRLAMAQRMNEDGTPATLRDLNDLRSPIDKNDAALMELFLLQQSERRQYPPNLAPRGGNVPVPPIIGHVSLEASFNRVSGKPTQNYFSLLGAGLERHRFRLADAAHAFESLVHYQFRTLVEVAEVTDESNVAY